MTEVLRAVAISRSYRDGSRLLQILNDVHLSVAEGEQVAILGPSGSGKSTLLHVLAGLLSPDAGEVWVEDQMLTYANASKKARIRNQSMGFVYQFHHLLPEFSAVENVAMPLWISSKLSQREISQKSRHLLKLMGLDERLDHHPHQLSGGEKQRVAVARALIADPAVVLADEPTGNLDSENAEIVLEQLLALKREFNTAFVLVTHDQSTAKLMDRTLWLNDGNLSSEQR